MPFILAADRPAFFHACLVCIGLNSRIGPSAFSRSERHLIGFLDALG
ncbi:hypothetical protein NBRC111894_1826 [Sporolactobacillus inulinus]|uniref:Uncharacterized protein n=1 Tax=Sporolactobacillus inulinus TaxID=2078 RepID=A0A4Y1ZB20_9BACL|nr:hypothetical protein NBRC111894_1826 [Sporolactobacillus inulinus]